MNISSLIVHFDDMREVSFPFKLDSNHVKAFYQFPITNLKVCRHKIGIIRVCSNNMLSNAQSTLVSEAVVTQITNGCMLAEHCRQAPEWMERRTNCQLDKQHASQTIKRITAGVDKLAHSTRDRFAYTSPFWESFGHKIKVELACMYVKIGESTKVIVTPPQFLVWIQ